MNIQAAVPGRNGGIWLLDADATEPQVLSLWPGPEGERPAPLDLVALRVAHRCTHLEHTTIYPDRRRVTTWEPCPWCRAPAPTNP